MSTCVVADSATGVLSVTATDPCTTLVVMTPAEFVGLSASPLNLTPSDGAELAASILGVWAIAWALRSLARALNTDGEVEEL